MKYFAYLLLLCGVVLGVSCQTGKTYSGAVSWGSFSEAPRQNKDASDLNPELNISKEPEHDTLKLVAKTGQEMSFPLLASAGPAQALVPLLNRPEKHQAVSASTKIAKNERIAVNISQEEPRRLSRLAVAGFAASALSFLPFVLGFSLLFSIPLAVAGIWLSRKASRRITNDRESYTGLGLAKAGFAIGVIVLGLLLTLGALALVAG